MTAARDVVRPRIDAPGAAALAADLYGVAGEVTELPSERDRNFLIDTEAGRFVLKIAHADTPAESLKLQQQAFALISAHGDTIAVPALVADRSGAGSTSVDLGGTLHHVRLVTYVGGRTLGSLVPKPFEVIRRVGALAGRLLEALADLDATPLQDDFAWDLRRAAATVVALAPSIPEPRRTKLLRQVASAAAVVAAHDGQLPLGVIHGDLNDHNVIVGDRIGAIDFGDLHRSYRIAEVAIAAAYAAFGFPDPVEVVASVASGANAVTPLHDDELAVLASLVTLRLAVSVAMAAEQTAADPDNAYLAISEQDAWSTLERLDGVPLRLAEARIRAACGRPAVASSRTVVEWLRQNAASLSSPLELELDPETTCVIDWSVTAAEAVHPTVAPPMVEQVALTEETMRRNRASVGLGRYGEPRWVYAAPEFATPTNRGPAARTVHLGVDLSCPVGTGVRALCAGTVERVEVEALDGGYGPVVTLRHEPSDALVFHTLYGHLDAAAVAHLSHGDVVATGETIGAVGAPPENGNWPPHLHFQLVTDLLDLDGPFPGVALPDEWEVWTSLSPSPAAALRLPAHMVDAQHPDDVATVQRRRAVLPPSLTTSYGTPLVAVRGFGSYLYDGWGRAHLDCVNNVAHVGHEHPRVVAALTAQARLLNTNSRYPHPERVRYLERLLARFPDRFDTAFLVGSGSEANDLALRIARTVTGRHRLVVVEGAYHGHTGHLIEASPYKHDGPGGVGPPDHVHVVPIPDPYRFPDRGDGSAVHVAFAAAAAEGGAAALVAEPILGVAGQVVPPAGWLRRAFAQARDAGALSIADEVQVGMGRIGTHWWAFERDGAVPDIVTLGKPLGNGHPLAAVVTTREIAAAFANGMEYFNTFGGNPVAAAVGNAVIDVIEDEGLMERAIEVGAHLTAGFRQLAGAYPLLGDVRGAGMFLGIELVTDRDARTAASHQAHYIVERARHMRVLWSVDGLHHNVIKFKPPLTFGLTEADRVIDLLDTILAEDGAQPDTARSALPQHS
ncbi:MAG TPA: aminotransferase class III-fold pyridoxal phosphate-dependent enzyme [Acidimicrobiia bacterium]|jgi:4-aminobutyrate aminotransferase-like enzyme/Ser/Thr protein kinase RdoA (MazF antagonist)|nr:aminotransferase class III-fold pyridoxal phosphate-dependent enzyme [Acidimicrobiia bacterium]